MGKFLILQFLELHTRGFTSSSSLKPRQNTSDLILTSLFHNSKDTSPEENLGMAKTPLLLVQLVDLKDGTSGFVILGLCNGLGSKDIVSSLELWIQHFVGESGSADGNSGQHTITLVLMHHKSRLNASRLLVSVGDNTTDEMGLSLVESGHQIIKLTLEVR